ncbi:MAG: PspC domain-containing protein [Bacteroidales bacterium]|nr:PspC domain-containing protein [Bacteroidota bacterium]MBL6950268.1 PspC domain-containing protein [Bacteroidales bacterium]
MKKTVNINVNGIIFHIDEDAYTKLNSYLNSLKKHFQTVKGSSDIIDDIEARIAELLQEKLSGTKQVISIQDVDEVIEVMGQPSQFEEEGTAEEQAPEAGPTKTTKRFYRDPDEKVVAGVCSGIGSYLHWDPVIIRILFIISLFIGGFGVALYLILWIVIPEAQTTAEKLEMRGEKINVSTIEQSIHEEVSTIKDKLNDLTETTKEKFRKGSPVRSPIEQIFKGIGEVLRVFGKALLIILGVTISLIGISFFIMLLAVLFGWGGNVFVDGEIAILSFPAMVDLTIGCSINPFYMQLALLIFLGIPVILLLYAGTRLIFKFDRIRYFGITAFNIWLIGLVICVFYAFKIYRNYKAEGRYHQEIAITQPISDTLYLQYDHQLPNDNFYLDEYEVFDDIKISRDDLGNYYLIPTIRIMTGYNDHIDVSKRIEARGRTMSDARHLAQAVKYEIRQSGDTLMFPLFAEMEDDKCWQGEQIVVTIRVPEGQYLMFGVGKWRYQHEYYHDTFSYSQEELFVLTDSGLDHY